MIAPASPKSNVRYANFVDQAVAPHADAWDQNGRIPESIIHAMGQAGHLAALVPARYGGAELDADDFGALNRQLGRGCSSVRSLLTVHSMAAYAVSRWGSEAQKCRWLPYLAKPDFVAAFALTEPEAGSDTASLSMKAEEDEDGFLIEGVKRWITFGQRADLFLCFARTRVGATAFLVPAGTPGLSIVPINGMFGTRASMLAELRFEGCRVPADAMLGRQGFGLSAVASTALEVGRFSVACGSAGILDACLKAALRHAGSREQFGRKLIEHQLIAAKVSEMATNAAAAGALCEHAGQLRKAGDPGATRATWMAKYFASTRAYEAASDLVQIMGARGCEDGSTAQRLLRDAKIMEIIEGSTQIQEITIAGIVYQDYLADGTETLVRLRGAEA